MASSPEVLRAMRKVRIWRVFQTYKFRVGKGQYCLKRTYKSEENARSQSCQGLKANRIGSSSSLPRARVRSRGRVFGLSVSLFVCPPLFALFARSRHFQELFIQYTSRSSEKSSL